MNGGATIVGTLNKTMAKPLFLVCYQNFRNANSGHHVAKIGRHVAKNRCSRRIPELGL
jgi:hypothetical protein